MPEGGYNEMHAQLRDALAKYLDAKVTERHAKWCEEDRVDEAQLREIFREMGSYGWIMPWAEVEYGGCEADSLSSCVIAGTIGRKGLSGVSAWLHGETAGPYLAKYGTSEQKRKYLAPAVKGEDILCVAMTEPNSGSDLASIKTSAARQGDEYVLNGSKCFITNGSVADTMIVACKTGEPRSRKPCISLFVLESTMPGITRRHIRKIGGNYMDTAEIFFEDVRVPVENLLGTEGEGYAMLMDNLPHERLIAAANYQGIAERGLELTINYAKERSLFGKRLADQQNVSFAVAELYAKVLAGQAMVKDVSERVEAAGDACACMAEVSAAKMYTAAIAQECLRTGVQVHGGYGVCHEYEIGRLFVESATYSIAAGTSEVMKLIVGRTLLPRTGSR